MIYNAEGEVVSPCIIHSGQVRDAVQRYFEADIWFVDTPNGELSQKALVEIVKKIEM